MERNFYIVRAEWDGEDRSDSFIKSKKWFNGYKNKYKKNVCDVNEGDILILCKPKKKVYAIGICTKNKGNGKELSVNWDKKYQFTYEGVQSRRKTIQRIQDGNFIKDFLNDNFPKNKSFEKWYYNILKGNGHIATDIDSYTRDILKFRKDWSIKELEKMGLEKYTHKELGSFPHQIEYKYNNIGGIRGPLGSIKFGIYKIGDNSKHKKNRKNRKNKIIYGNKYAWHEKYGQNESEAFENIKKKIIQIIKYSQNKEWDKIDEIELSDAYKWKIAFIYQDIDNPFITPVFSNDLCRFALIRKGIILSKDLSRSQLYDKIKEEYNVNDIISAQKAMEEIFTFWNNGKKSILAPNNIRKNSGRNATTKKATSERHNKGGKTTVHHRHHPLQSNFIRFLKSKKIVCKEDDNYIDVWFKSKGQGYICEIKPSKTQEEIQSKIREAAGQLLSYMFFSQRECDIKVIVFQGEPDETNVAFLEFLDKRYNFKYLYECGNGKFKGSLNLNY